MAATINQVGNPGKGQSSSVEIERPVAGSGLPLSTAVRLASPCSRSDFSSEATPRVRGIASIISRKNLSGKPLAPVLILIAMSFCLTLAQGQSDPQNSSTQQPPINPKLPTLFVVGDSTANNH